MLLWKSAFAALAAAMITPKVEASNGLDDFQPQNIKPMSGDQLLRARLQMETMEEKATEQQKQSQPSHRRLFRWDDLKFWDTSHHYKWVFHDGFDPYNETGYRYARSDTQYSRYSQAYRMLGGYIDCDHPKDSGSQDQNNDNNGDSGSGCARWMMWAAYVNKNYSSQQGESRYLESYYNGTSDEYEKAANDDNSYYNYGTDDVYQNRDNTNMYYYANKRENNLDCGDQGSGWRLLGVYRQEFYQYYEQISKHMWAIDDASYVVALAGLSYMSDSDCTYAGKDYNGNKLYAGPQPLYGGYFQMGMYTDSYCVTLDNSGYTYDDFAAKTDLDLGCDDSDDDGASCFTQQQYYGNNNEDRRELGNNTDDTTSSSSYYNQGNFDYKVSDLSEAYEVWNSTQEYTMANFNTVYQDFMSCTPCMDYPTYQDGFFNGNTGYQEDDLVNQCWKFYSHDSYTCNGECQYFGLDQGTVNAPLYSDTYYGSDSGGYSGSTSSSSGSSSGNSGGSSSGNTQQNSGSSYNSRGTASRLFLESSDRDAFLSNTFILSSMIIFLTALSSYYCMGGSTSSLKNDMFEKQCCADDTTIREDELVSPAELQIDEIPDADDSPYYKPAPEPYNLVKSDTAANITKTRRTRGRSSTRRNDHVSSGSDDSDDKDEPLTVHAHQPVIVEAYSESTEASSRDEDYYKPPAHVY
jgi:hypothetical protein